jgi:hypothetical protein
MLSLRDCIDYASLSPSEVAAIAEHEHIPDIVAAELGAKLADSQDGRLRIMSYMLENIEIAQRCGQRDKAASMLEALKAFAEQRLP